MGLEGEAGEGQGPLGAAAEGGGAHRLADLGGDEGHGTGRHGRIRADDAFAPEGGQGDHDAINAAVGFGHGWRKEIGDWGLEIGEKSEPQRRGGFRIVDFRGAWWSGRMAR